MPAVNFYIEKRKKHDGTLRRENLPILLYFSYEGKRFQFNTGEKCHLKHWNSEKQRLYSNVVHSMQVNAYLDFLGEEVLEIYHKAKASGIRPGFDYLRNSLRNRGRSSGIDFFEAYMEFIDEHYDRWTISTFRKVKTSYNHLRKFSEQSGLDLSFEKIDRYFFDRYIHYYSDNLKHSNTTIHKNIMVLKWFLNWASRKGYNRNRYYRDHVFTWERQYKLDTANNALSTDELFHFLSYEFSDNRFSHARDIFCFMCFTGLKYTELSCLTGQNVSDDSIKLFIPAKNLVRSIPLNRYSRTILNKHFNITDPNIRVFPSYSSVTANRLIKMAGKESGISELVEIHACYGESIQRKRLPKWQVLSTKTATNTFIMNAFRLEIPLWLIMDYCGIKTQLSMERYRSEYDKLKASEIKKFERLLT